MKAWLFNRTILAAGLAALALGLPCIAWYLAGTRDVAHRAGELERETLGAARETARELAERLAGRLTALRESEGRRPYYQYQNLYHDPRGQYEGQGVNFSPLAEETGDPLIRTHFQVEEDGRLTLPTLNDEAPDAQWQAPAQLDEQKKLRSSLAPIIPQALAFDQGTPPAAISASSSSPPQAFPQRVEVLDQKAYQQNVEASQVYNELRQGKVTPRGKVGEQIRVVLDPFEWRTVTTSNVEALAALRRVLTPNGRLVQGFLIEPASVDSSLSGSAFPARFVSINHPAHAGIVIAPIADTRWAVLVDARATLAQLPVTRTGLRRTFLQQFFLGAGAALLAALCIVGLVWQSERLAKQRSQFAAAAAHELRTPLAGLRIYSDMLAEGLGDPSSSRKYARRIADEADRLGRVVANVLGFTRLERGILKVHPEPGDLAAIVRESVERQRPALEAAGLELVLDLREDLPAVAVDRDAVAQVLQNLLDNAEKHTRDAADRTVTVSVEASGREVELSVADHGPGLPAEVQRRLFRPFARAATPDAPAGLGLGLALTKALADAHRAAIRCSNTPRGGATFTVTFPTVTG